ncbi:AMP-binding protein [Paracoccus onubensis]|uniref:AMP-binding protein n=1 Tax=Paracoccus onubensis TaxID=1675788 RepID=UPI0027322757|nr:AMP-binding protein [Paracoccus onubensis]MDP0928585.1 AMP-binding protein [Paracoccus onubensis]
MTTLSGHDYQRLRRDFAWDFPEHLNMADQCLSHKPGGVAIIEYYDGAPHPVTYAELSRMTADLAHALQAARGECVAVLRTQSAWTAAAHLAVWKSAAISIPLFKLFGSDALELRLRDAGVRKVIADVEGREMLRPFADLEIIVPEDGLSDAVPFATRATGPEDPAVIIYTSGTTGSPKGALHGHRVLTGHLPGVEMSHDLLGQPGDCLWTPADWAWIGGLFDVLMPGLALGVPVVAARMPKFEPGAATKLIADCGVRNIFFPPTALKMLKAADIRIDGLRSVASGGETLGGEMLDWGRQAFGLEINEFYGQTECNMVASSASSMFPAQPGAIGKPVPGFDVQVIGEDGLPVEGEGDIAVRRGAGSMMLEYWNRPDATAEKFRGDWLVTGDRGAIEGGYIRFVGRDDDVITSAGYRIGPSEIEDCLLKHPAVAQVGVIGKPDSVRTEIVKAYIVLRAGFEVSDKLSAELQAHAKRFSAAHSYPREITFLDSLPMTVTGKVMRRELRALAISEARHDMSSDERTRQ